MDTSQWAGLSTQRLDHIKNYDARKKNKCNKSNYGYNDNRLYDILHQVPESVEENDNGNGRTSGNNEFYDDQYKRDNRIAGLESEMINNTNLRNRRNKYGTNYVGSEIKDILQNNFTENNNNDDTFSVSAKGNSTCSGNKALPKKCLTKHIDDTEIGKYFSTKYAVTDKTTGRTEIMVQRKPGSSNVIVQNFSAFDAYATFREENKRDEHPDSVIHTKMGIVPKEGLEQVERRNKSYAAFTDQNRRDNIAPNNYWLCPTVDSEQKRGKGMF